MNLSSLDQILAGGGATAKFDTIGTTYHGEIQTIEVRQVNDYDTGKPAFWDDGNPQEQIVVTIATSEQTSPDDDGHRNVYIKGWGDQLKAFRQGVKALGRNPKAGDSLTVTYTGDGEQRNPRFNPPKRFSYEFTAGAAGLSNLTGVQQSAPAQQAPQAQAQPQQAPAQQATPTDAQDLARQLIQLGLDDTTIANRVGVDPAAIAALRA